MGQNTQPNKQRLTMCTTWDSTHTALCSNASRLTCYVCDEAVEVQVVKDRLLFILYRAGTTMEPSDRGDRDRQARPST